MWPCHHPACSVSIGSTCVCMAEEMGSEDTRPHGRGWCPNPTHFTSSMSRPPSLLPPPALAAPHHPTVGRLTQLLQSYSHQEWLIGPGPGCLPVRIGSEGRPRRRALSWEEWGFSRPERPPRSAPGLGAAAPGSSRGHAGTSLGLLQDPGSPSTGGLKMMWMVRVALKKTCSFPEEPCGTV